MASDENELLQDVREAIVNFDADRLKRNVEQAINSGISAYDILMKGVAKGMEIVGKKYEEGDCFLPQLLAAGETMKVALEFLEPRLQAEKAEMPGRIVIGTVHGDLHDLGKNILAAMLKSAGFEVYDLGVDVAADRFVKEVKETGAHVLAMSALLTTTCSYMGEIIDALKKNDIRRNVKVIVGGLPTSEEFVKQIGADAYGKDAFDGLRKIKTLMKD